MSFYKNKTFLRRYKEKEHHVPFSISLLDIMTNGFVEETNGLDWIIETTIFLEPLVSQLRI